MTNSWIDKYQPQGLGDFLFPTTGIKACFQKIVSQAQSPNLLLHGPPGVGKTSLANRLPNLIDPKVQVRTSHCSQLCGPKDVRALQIKNGKNLLHLISQGDFYAFVLDEVDVLTKSELKALTGVMDYYGSDAMFIFTTNDFDRVAANSPALIDRCTCFHFARPTKTEFAGLAHKILGSEGKMGVSQLDLARVVGTAYPSVRTLIADLELEFR